ncbi:hypothetical protein [Streptacidiphilus sp. PAMC 29251]
MVGVSCCEHVAACSKGDQQRIFARVLPGEQQTVGLNEFVQIVGGPFRVTRFGGL